MVKTGNALIVFALLLCTAACSINPTTFESEFNVVSETKEVNIGRGADPQPHIGRPTQNRHRHRHA